MAYADWSGVHYLVVGGFRGGQDAVQVVNSTLSGPLTLSGQDCRKWEALGQAEYAFYKLDPTAHPTFTVIPDTKAISLRAWVRWDGTIACLYSENQICLRAKLGLSTDYSQGERHGYSFGINGGCGRNPAPFYWQGGNKTGANVIVDTGSTLAFGTWAQIRMDVIPTSPSVSDTIRCYINTGTEASPIWTLEYERIQLASETNVWIPWGDADYGNVGFGVRVYQGPVGQPALVHMDGFDARLKDV